MYGLVDTTTQLFVQRTQKQEKISVLLHQNYLTFIMSKNYVLATLHIENAMVNSISMERLLKIIGNSTRCPFSVPWNFLYSQGSVWIRKSWMDLEQGAHSLQAPYSADPPRLATSKIRKVGAPRPLLKVYIVMYRPIARQRLGKPTRATVGRLFLNNGPVNMPKTIRDTRRRCFPWGPLRGYITRSSKGVVSCCQKLKEFSWRRVHLS
jgi:hypothetical protein